MTSGSWTAAGGGPVSPFLALAYDGLGLLWRVAGASSDTRFLYDPGSVSGAGSDQLAAEYDAAGTVLRRYAWGPEVDEPVLWDEGGALNCTGARLLMGDHQGSVVGLAICSGALRTVNRYDDWGTPDATNVGRFQYTGQAWLPDLGLYHYKARMYAPATGRFLQTDPVGYDDQVNLYAYVGNDPVNGRDQTGMETEEDEEVEKCTGSRNPGSCADAGSSVRSEGSVRQGSTQNGAGAVLPSIAAIAGPGGIVRHIAGEIADQVTERALNLRDAVRKGQDGEAQAEAKIVDAGYTIVGRQVYVQTSIALRNVDILSVDATGRLVGFEVKTSPDSRYNSMQRDKDSVIASRGGTIVSKGLLGGGLQRGDRVRFPTMWAYIYDVPPR